MHPHIAPINGYHHPGYSRPPGTPQLNIPDGVWNNGEGFRLVGNDHDYGGHLGPAEPGLQLEDIFSVEQTIGGTPGWKQITYFDKYSNSTISLWHFKGYLRPNQLGPYLPPPTEGPKSIEDAAFELFLPVTGGSQTNVVLMIHAWATTGKTPIKQGGRHVYPGRARTDGLADDGFGNVLRHIDPAFVHHAAVSGVTVMSGHIVPRVFGRAAVFEVQRYRELRQAMRLMLAAPPSDFRHPPSLEPIPLQPGAPPCMLVGGSNGGLIAQAMCVRWPGEFRGSYSETFGPSPRRVLADQFHLEYAATRTGFSSWGGAYSPHDTLEWGTAFRWMDPAAPDALGFDFFSLSPLIRWRRGELRGVMAWFQPDEDTIGHGTDFFTLLTGQRSYAPRVVVTGAATMAFASVDRRCHDTGWHRSALQGLGSYWRSTEDTVELAAAVWNDWIANPTLPPDPAPILDDNSEDSYAWVLDRILQPDHQAGTNDPLVLDTSFGTAPHLGRSEGAGLALGLDESLRFADIPSLGKCIFTGSADGVVTRYTLDATTLAPKIAQQSMPLGYGAFGLAVGELSDGHPGMEVVVGTKQHLFVLDPVTLGVIEWKKLPLNFEQARPRRIQIADVIQSLDYPGKDIVLTTLMGHLLVISGEAGLGDMVDLGEPGIQDLAVLEGMEHPNPGTTEATPVLLLSHRGHVASLSLNTVTDPMSRNPAPAMLQAWTAGEHGGPADLEIVDAPVGGGKVAVCLYGHEGEDEQGADVPQIRCFDALTMQPTTLGTHGIPGGLGWKELNIHGQHVSIVPDLAPIHFAGTNGPLAGFVLLLGSRIAFVPADGSQTPHPPEGYKLDGFAPAARALAVTTADLTTRVGGETYKEEIILSTLAGRLVWIHLEDLLANGNNEYVSAAGMHADASQAGQWGLLVHDEGQGERLFGANQCGELHQIDPATGAATKRGSFRESHDFAPTPNRDPSTVTAPIRDLVRFGAGVQQSSAVEAALLTTTIPNDPLRWLQTKPWEDVRNDVTHPIWVKDIVTFNGQTADFRSLMPVLDGFAALVASGDVLESGSPVAGATRQIHCWGGDFDAFSNMVQGVYLDGTQVLDNWYSSKPGPTAWVEPSYPPSQGWHGRSSGDGKDLRNEVRQFSAPHNLQSLRIGQDAHGPVVVGSTPGGSVVLLRPGHSAGQQTNQDYGTVLWDSADPSTPADEGMFAMGLALRPVPNDPNQALDIFLGVGITHLDPGPWHAAQPGPGNLTGGIAWYRWVGSAWGTGSMTRMGLLHLDASTANAIGPRGGFHVCGLAVGDVVDDQPGDELVATTMEGDLFVFSIPGSGMLTPANIVWRSWVRGTLGVSNSIVIHDFDNDNKNELYIAGSLGIWKWRQP
ncbi:MAG: hypothetical protein HZB39_18990 [Planctomycetes bacterium]|nr:hypothetical protein [Planctomycetota bacterium]